MVGSTLAALSLKLASACPLNILGRVVQMLAAFLVVRSLAKTDYAWYSLAQNLIGALGMFTVTGISTGLMPIAGEAAGDRERLGVVLFRRAVSALLLAFERTHRAAGLRASAASQPVPAMANCPFLPSRTPFATLTSIAPQMMATLLSLARRYNEPQIEVP